ncbi:PKD domain-containing protein [Cryomorphaceae bacterium 1068]|nr:PKD domain-containing protein [Cryomorphaceae bacterium 1068]
MANQLNDFDRLIKETYENHEFPYDSSVWDGVEKDLGATSPGILDFFKSVTTGLAIAGAVFATMLIFSSDSGSLMTIAEEQKIEAGDGTIDDKSKTAFNQSDEKVKVNNSTNRNDLDQNQLNSETPSGLSQGTPESNGNDEVNFTEEQKSTVVAVLAEAKKIASSEESTEPIHTEDINNEIYSASSVKRGCTGLTINFDAPEEYGSNAKYLWNFGDGFFSNEENPTHVFNKEGIFDVSLSVTAVGSGQISSNVVQAMIEVHEAPKAIFDLEIHSMTDIRLQEKSMNAAEFEWLIDNKKPKAEGVDVLLSIADNTKFDIELIAENAGNCSDSLNKEIHIIKAGNQFPQLYSSAYASDFAPGAIVDNGAVTDFRVFQKGTGEEVFKSSGSKGWNGKNKKGEEVTKGEYEWMMVVDSEDVFNIYHGTLNVR